MSVSIISNDLPVMSSQRLRRFSRPMPVEGSLSILGALRFDTTSVVPSVRIDMCSGSLRVMVLCFTALPISGCSVRAGRVHAPSEGSMSMSKNSLSA